MGTDLSSHIILQLPSEFTIFRHSSLEQLNEYLSEQSILSLPDIILIETDEQGDCFEFIKKLKQNVLFRDLIIVLITTLPNREWKSRALQLKVHDHYTTPFPIEHFIERLNFLVKFKLIRPQLASLEKVDVKYKLPNSKKIFDIIVASLSILLLSPILLLAALFIRLDSRGPVIYVSKRVGTGYNIFNFYKFRSMRMDAEVMLEDLAELNRYKEAKENTEGKSVFIKLKADPRITRFGHFIRSTSIDELPQLFNVLKGDMSLVGNRPLPLYEAEHLTSNEWSMRFMGPAGLTGLWQIKSRGKRDISERERKKLDNFYATNYSFWFDIEILFKTIFVLFHKEKV